MKVRIIRYEKPAADFRALVEELDEYLSITDEDEHDFYDQFNSIDNLKHVVVAYLDNFPVGCGAFREYGPHLSEIKRMFVKPEFRNKGIANLVISELELWCKELGYSSCLLETGKRQVEAVNFYQKAGYSIIPNFDQYKEMENSLCFKKVLN